MILVGFFRGSCDILEGFLLDLWGILEGWSEKNSHLLHFSSCPVSIRWRSQTWGQVITTCPWLEIVGGILREFWGIVAVKGFLRDSLGVLEAFLRDSLVILEGFLRDSCGILEGFLLDSWVILEGFLRWQSQTWGQVITTCSWLEIV